jgi:xylulokinase
MKGEKAPILDDSARGAFMGLTLNHSREHLVRSVMEGVAFNIRWVRDKMKSQNLDFDGQSLRAIGGGFNSRIWTQILADIMCKEIRVVKWPQYAGAIGAALIATLGTGVYANIDDLHELLPVSYKARPRKRYSGTYDRLLRNFKETYPSEIARIYHEWDSDLATERK